MSNPRCGKNHEGQTRAVSHEIIEAAIAPRIGKLLGYRIERGLRGIANRQQPGVRNHAPSRKVELLNNPTTSHYAEAQLVSGFDHRHLSCCISSRARHENLPEARSPARDG